MQFNAGEPKMQLLFCFFIMLTLFIVSKWIPYLFMAIFCLISTYVKHHFKVHENDLSFTISLFGLVILKRKANKDNIKWIEFTRTDWHTKSTFIRLEKGFRWKISRFHPNNFDKSIEDFAINNAIEIKKHFT